MRRLVVLLPAALVLAACGGSSTKSAQTSSAVAQTIQISEKEYSLSPSTVNLPKTGTYEFMVANNGTITHAFEIEGNGVKEKSGDIQAGSSTSLRVTLSKGGSYDIYCPIDGHRAQGMKGTVTVGTASSAGTTTDQTTTGSRPGY